MPDAKLADRELERLRAMSPAEKLAVSEALWRDAWRLKAASFRSRHPEWSDAQVESATRQALSGGQ